MAKQYHFSTKVMWLIQSFVLVICLFWVGDNTFAASSQAKGRIEQLIQTTERQYGIPSGLLAAIAQVESEMNVHALNVDGERVMPSNIHEASTAIENAKTKGINNIDIGIMQINYRWHGAAFNNTKEMLMPENNIKYGAKLLKSLKAQHGTWYEAVKYYHSAKPEHHRKYSRKVVVQWGRKYT